MADFDGNFGTFNFEIAIVLPPPSLSFPISLTSDIQSNLFKNVETSSIYTSYLCIKILNVFKYEAEVVAPRQGLDVLSLRVGQGKV